MYFWSSITEILHFNLPLIIFIDTPFSFRMKSVLRTHHLSSEIRLFPVHNGNGKFGKFSLKAFLAFGRAINFLTRKSLAKSSQIKYSINPNSLKVSSKLRGFIFRRFNIYLPTCFQTY